MFETFSFCCKGAPPFYFVSSDEDMIPILSVVVKMTGINPMDKEIGIEKEN